MNELNILSANIGNGWVKSHSVNGRKISTIMMKQGIRRFIQMKGGKGESSDGYQIYIRETITRVKRALGRLKGQP